MAAGSHDKGIEKGHESMDRARIAEELDLACAIAVLRAPSPERATALAEALQKGGFRSLEITMTVPQATEAIRRCSRLEGVLVGAGTVLTANEVARCADSGARFIVSPILSLEVLEAAHQRDLVAIPGAMTPTEAFNGWRAGADFVKIFPASRLGPKFLSDLRAPLPQIPLAPTGGLTGENAAEYLAAGAALLGFGSWLVGEASGDLGRVTQRAKSVIEMVKRFRERGVRDD
jgi:2-dehydro-3-deoxyphosphogluconate aldolase/(4S)-4-hydroxy-2-oxoglutarate aldolase